MSLVKKKQSPFLSRRAKSIGVHKCSGAGTGTVFGMFMWETGIIILLSLFLMVFLMFNFREFVEDTTAAKLESLFAVERIWVPFGVTAVLFLIGGVLPGRIFSKIPVTQVFRRYTEGKKGWKRPLLFIQFAGVAFICGLMWVVMLQYHYVINKDPGYNPERVVIGVNNAPDAKARLAARHFYEGLPYVEALTSATSYPSNGYSGQMIPDEKGTSLFSSRYDFTQENYVAFMGNFSTDTVPQPGPQQHPPAGSLQIKAASNLRLSVPRRSSQGFSVGLPNRKLPTW